MKLLNNDNLYADIIEYNATVYIKYPDYKVNTPSLS